MASSQAPLLVALLFFAMAVNYSSGAYCVCKSGLSDAIYQKALDYACGNGGDCSPIAPSGACYNPNTLQGHCSYAVNSYYQKKSQQGATCDFGGTATLSSSAPTTSSSSCSLPSGGSTSGSSSTSPSTTTPSTSPTTPTTTPVSGTPTSGTPVSGTPTSGTPVSGTPTSGTSTGTGTTPVSGTPTTSSPYTTAPTTMGTTNPSTGTSPYLGGGIAPTGVGMNDENHASGLKSAAAALCSALAGLVLLSWN